MINQTNNFKRFPIFLGRLKIDNQINFFKSFIFECGDLYRFSKSFYRFWNTVAWFNFLKIAESGGLFAAFCSNYFLLKFKKFVSRGSSSAYVLPSNFFVSCGGFLSNFAIFRWYAFFSKIRIPKKMPNAVLFLDGLVPEHYLVECLKTRTISVAFFHFSQRVYGWSNVLFFQPWVDNSSKFLLTNFYLFISFLKPVLAGVVKLDS